MVPQAASIEVKGLKIFNVFFEGCSSSMLAVLATIHNSAPQYKTFHVKNLFLTPCRSQLLCILKWTPCRSLSLSKHYPIPNGLMTNSKSMRQKIQWILSCRNQNFLKKDSIKWHLCLVMFGVTSQWYGGGGLVGVWLNVDYNRFALFVYNLQAEFPKNLHLQLLHL